jgi:putative phosphoesterase
VALIGLISDVHAAPAPVAEALAIFSRAGVDQVFCAGDIAGYMDEPEQTINLLIDQHCQCISGNHDLLYLDHHEDEKDNAAVRFLRDLPVSYESVIEGKKVYMVHAQPPEGCHGGIKLLDKNGALMADKVALWTERLNEFDYDVLVVGHTHQVFVEFLGDSLVINPGSSVFNNSCAILSLPEMTVELFALSGKQIQTTWNWGEHVIYGK